MPPSLLNKGLATALSVASGLAWAGPKLSGPYVGDTYGQVALQMEGERLVGTSTGGTGGCKFAPGTPVLAGEFQGNVLVGTVKLCLTGPAECAPSPQDFPVLAIYNPQSAVLSAVFRLPSGCQSPGLKDTLWVLRNVGGPQEEREDDASAQGESEAPAEEAEAVAPEAVAPPTAGGAPALAKSAEARPRSTEVPLVDQGLQLLAARKWEVAQTRFDAALQADGRSVDALVGLAACQLGLGQASKAVDTLDRIRPVPPSRPDVYVWQAHAYGELGSKGRIPGLLRRALEQGWSPANPKPYEAGLVKVLAGDIEQAQKLLVKNRKRVPGRESTGSGSASP